MSAAAGRQELESFAETELEVIGMVAQMKSLGPVVAKVSVTTDGRRGPVQGAV